MTLTKSLLLGSAATLVVVAGAQAADLPTKKGAPAAEYVKVCKVGDIAGFIIPGSDTCLKISGYVNAQIAAGNVSDERKLEYFTGLGGGAEVTTSAAKYVNDLGFSTRGQVNFDAVTNTAMGPLLAHIEIQSNSGVGFDPLGNGAVLNAGYVQWAGITAGKHGSFYDYLAGGDTWKDFFSPDHSGTPINLLAYTATFGGGFSATLSLEQNELVSGFNVVSNTAVGTKLVALSGTPLGVRAPDIIGSLDVTQSWGGAHLAGVAHNIRQELSEFSRQLGCRHLGLRRHRRRDLQPADAFGGQQDRVPGRLRPRRDRLFRRRLAGLGRAGPGLQHQRQRHIVPDGRRRLHIRHQLLVAVGRLVGCGSIDLEGLAQLRDRSGSRLRQRRLWQQF